MTPTLAVIIGFALTLGYLVLSGIRTELGRIASALEKIAGCVR